MQGAYTFFNWIAISFGKGFFLPLYDFAEPEFRTNKKSPNEQFLFIIIYVSLYWQIFDMGQFSSVDSVHNAPL